MSTQRDIKNHQNWDNLQGKKEGIVLRAPTPTQPSITVLDAVSGKLRCFIHHKSHNSYAAGLRIEYVTTHFGHTLYLEQGELISSPFDLARDDILFIHHLLELCDRFMPIDSPAPEIWSLLLQLYTWDVRTLVFTHKLFFLSRLVLLLGLHERYPVLELPVLEQLLSFSVDRVPWPTLDLDSQRSLRVWLVETILCHIPSEQFTTLSFLRDIR